MLGALGCGWLRVLLEPVVGQEVGQLGVARGLDAGNHVTEPSPRVGPAALGDLPLPLELKRPVGAR